MDSQRTATSESSEDEDESSESTSRPIKRRAAGGPGAVSRATELRKQQQKRRTSKQQQRKTIKAHQITPRGGRVYLAADPFFRVKLGISNSRSQGYEDRVKGKPASAFWGAVMAWSVPVRFGRCNKQYADLLSKVYEFINLLLFRHFLVSTDHEVRIPEFVLSSDCP